MRSSVTVAVARTNHPLRPSIPEKLIGSPGVFHQGTALPKRSRDKFTSDRIGSLGGLESKEVSPVLRLIKQAGTRLNDDRLVEPSSARTQR
ncbi:hypothetical protein [Streptomyces sp. NPDC094149]|uniref:hypothetical protein n=1 Tax=Streptomyces sp. NPDC094149 TaxID=3155079 RepID=UPI00332AB910